MAPPVPPFAAFFGDQAVPVGITFVILVEVSPQVDINSLTHSFMHACVQ